VLYFGQGGCFSLERFVCESTTHIHRTFKSIKFVEALFATSALILINKLFVTVYASPVFLCEFYILAMVLHIFLFLLEREGELVPVGGAVRLNKSIR
jgi:hypothetical protein